MESPSRIGLCQNRAPKSLPFYHHFLGKIALSRGKIHHVWRNPVGKTQADPAKKKTESKVWPHAVRTKFRWIYRSEALFRYYLYIWYTKPCFLIFLVLNPLPFSSAPITTALRMLLGGKDEPHDEAAWWSMVFHGVFRQSSWLFPCQDGHPWLGWFGEWPSTS